MLKKSRVLIDWFMHAKIRRFYGHPSFASLLVHLPALATVAEKEHKTDESVSARSQIRPCERQRERERDLHRSIAFAARQLEANRPLVVSLSSGPALFRGLVICARGVEDTRVRGMRVKGAAERSILVGIVEVQWVLSTTTLPQSPPIDFQAP